ncbi:MAG: CPBP family intramembrane metalloprotease [Bacteroidales bacterium]|nr:CPBP family intramembrane metalloprotease [Bacteroidales bacterium]
MKKSTHPLMQLLVMLALALGLMLVATIISVPFIFAGGGHLSTTSMLWVQSITQILTFAVPVLLMTTIYYRRREREYYRFDFSGRKWFYALVGVVIMLLMTPLIEWLTEWNDLWQLGALGDLMRKLQEQTEAVIEQMITADTVGGLVANLLVIAVVPAICEELFFRAGIQNLLQRWISADGRKPWGVHVAIWLTALIFSLAHGEVFAFMPRFIMGATLGYLYVYSGSLLPNMLAHCVNNAIVVVLYWLVARGVLDIDPEAPLHFGTVLTVACTLAAILLFYVNFLLPGRKSSERRTELSD